jgi:hypothetical protein
MKKSLLTLILIAATAGLLAEEAAPPSAAKLALAREVIATLQADKMIDGMMGQMKAMANQSAPIAPDATPEQRAQAEKLQGDILAMSMTAAKKMVAEMDQLYAEVYTDGELQAMKSFFSSPEGRSMMAKQPQLMQRLMPLMQKMQQDLVPQIQALMAASKAQTPATAP